ncbi:MAG: class I SAM-dependent methyltransferase [Pyrinomonadaceae bacterium]
MMRSVLDRIPLTVERRPVRLDLQKSVPGRFSYQQRYINFDIRPGERVLDIGSGGNPFPLATHLVDRFLESTPHREGSIVQDGKPLVTADIHLLPFPDKSFDFVYCAHILEHVDSPVKACAEIMRIGKRGYLETPTMGEDMLFAWAKDRHKWHVVGINRTLCFFEYTARQQEGIRTSVWEEVIMSRRQHPLQQAYHGNIDIFAVMFPWTDSFTVYVFHLDGSVESLNAQG